ncbi:hypothetical protein JG687_00018511 [Phytophthora cactorum]|uniref:Uncharacterized protein n=1 Tax=Phytophthora cactorum TaxID=29920 RepID=A0A8T1TMJ5_9STRA|nr:hypothetical protein JG687_00018511 [Phytophthora cactorum]
MPMHYTDQSDDYRGKHNNINVPLQCGTTDDQFHGRFQRLVDKAVDAVEPEIVGACLRCRHAGSRSTERS